MVALRANRHGIVGLVAEILDAMDWYGLVLFGALVFPLLLFLLGLRDDIRPFWTVN